MLRKIPRKLGLAGFVALSLADLQLYAHRFHPPTEMLGQYLRQLVVPEGLAEPTKGSDSPDLRSRMDALVQKAWCLLTVGT